MVVMIDIVVTIIGDIFIIVISPNTKVEDHTPGRDITIIHHCRGEIWATFLDVAWVTSYVFRIH